MLGGTFPTTTKPCREDMVRKGGHTQASQSLVPLCLSIPLLDFPLVLSVGSNGAVKRLKEYEIHRRLSD